MDGIIEIIVEGLSAIDEAVFTPVYYNALAELAAKLDAAEAALLASEDISELVVELYSTYVSAFAYNPDADGYADLVNRYLAICDA